MKEDGKEMGSAHAFSFAASALAVSALSSVASDVNKVGVHVCVYSLANSAAQ